MELSQKEKILLLAALHKYMEHFEHQLQSEDVSEEVQSEIANDASLLEILIYKAEQELRA
jgi:hypothetical protein